MPIQIRNHRPPLQLSEPAREGFTTVFLAGLIGFVAVRWFVARKKAEKPKQL